MLGKGFFTQRPRLTLWSLFIFGVSVWYVPLIAALAMSVITLCLAIMLGAAKKERRGIALAYVFFALFWSVGRVFLSLYNNSSWIDGVWQGLDLALRLLAVGGAGMAVLCMFTPYQLAVTAGKSFMRLAPRSFWKLSLALLLMLSFLGEAFQTWLGLKRSLSLRGRYLSLTQKIKIMAYGVLRILACQTWDRALTIAARKLDRVSAWE